MLAVRRETITTGLSYKMDELKKDKKKLQKAKV
jgi:hypothetical protein